MPDDKNTPASAVIRQARYPEDDKLTRLFVGKSCMEPLAIANRKFSTSRTTIAVWLAFSSTVVGLMNLWPDPNVGWISYFMPIPIYAVTYLPLVFLADWLQRSYFDEEAITVLKRPDIVHKESYYARSPASGFWILELGKTFVGLAAVDASKDSLLDETIMEKDDAETKKKYASKGTGSTAVIRHFYVLEQFRKVDIQKDLLAFALKRTFEASPNVQTVRFTPSPLFFYLEKTLKKAGFEVVQRGKPVGILRWTTLTYEISREKWRAQSR